MKRVLVQAGHQSPRQPGHESQTGAQGEVELVTAIQRALVRLLDQDADFHAVAVPGRIPGGVRCDAAIFLHADGAANPEARGYSMGFPRYEVNRRLADLIGEEFEKLPGHPPRRSDNYTLDMAEYYGYALVDTPGPEVLVEHGFLSNPEERRWLKGHVGNLAEAEHKALRRFFHLPEGVTPDSKLLAAARAPAARAEQYLLARPHGEYSDGDVRRLVHLYYETAVAVGLDPLLAVAQMTLETAHLTSFWSQRPRRNLAGIGVTGEPGKGLSFPGLKAAVKAHTGRLLAYALPKGTATGAQVQLIDEALAYRPLPDSRRGAAARLRGLAGTWAQDPQYAVKLARLANEIRAHRS